MPLVKGASSIAGTAQTIPTHAIGDLILIWASRDGSTTPPTKPGAGGTVPAWVTIDGPTGSNLCSQIGCCFVATATNHTTGTWLNATGLLIVVISGQKAGTGLAPIGGHNPGVGGANSTGIIDLHIGAVVPVNTDGNSLIVRCVSARTVTAWGTVPSGWTAGTSIPTEIAFMSKNSSTSEDATGDNWTNTFSANGGFQVHGVEILPATTPVAKSVAVSYTVKKAIVASVATAYNVVSSVGPLPVWTLLGSFASSVVANSASITLAQNQDSGTILVVVSRLGAVATHTVSDSRGGNTYRQDAFYNVGASRQVASCKPVNLLQSGDTVTVNFSASDSRHLYVYQVSSLNQTTWFNSSKIGNGTSTAADSGTQSLVAGRYALLGVTGSNPAVVTAGTNGQGVNYTQLHSITTDAVIATEHMLVGPASTLAYKSAATLSVSQSWNQIFVAYNIAGTTSVAQSVAVNYNVKTSVSKSLVVSYNVKKSIAKTLTPTYNVNKQIVKTLTSTYNVKKQIAKTLAISYAIVAGGAPPYSSVILADGPTGYWRMEESGLPQDSSGSGNHMTSDNNSVPQVTGLLANSPTSKARGFVASGQSFLAANRWMTLNTFSIEFWVKLTGPQTTYILTQYNGGAGFIIYSTGELALDGGNPTSTLKITDTNIHHVVVTRNGIGGTTTYYLDGVSETVTPTSYDYSNPPNNAFFIGSQWGNYPLDGTLDEVAIYPTVLTSTKVSTHYTTGNTPGSASTPVTKALTLTYNVKATVTKTLVLAYNVKKQITKTSTFSYNVRVVVTKTVTPAYNVIGRITKTVTPVYNVKKSIVKTSTFSYNVIGRVIVKTLTPAYNVRKIVTQTITPAYNVKRQIAKTSTFSYNIITRVAIKTLTPAYNIRKLVVQTAALTYNVKRIVSQTVTPAYNVKKAIVKTVTPAYNIVGRIAKTVTPTYNVKKQIVKTQQFTYNLLSLGAVSKQQTFSYNVRAYLSKTATFNYFVRTTVAVKTVTPSYTVRKAIVKTVAPTYNVRQQITKALSPNYFVRVIAAKTITPVYNVKKQIPKTQTFSYNIISLTGVGKSLALSYNIQKSVTVTYSASYLVKRAVAKTLSPVYLVRQRATGSATFSYNVRKIVLKTSTFTYNVTKANVTKTFTASYLIRVKATKTVTLSYTIRISVVRIRLYSYNIKQGIVKPYTLAYRVRAYLRKDLLLVYSVGSATISPTGKLAVVQPAIGYTTITINGHTSTEIQPANGYATINSISSSLNVR